MGEVVLEDGLPECVPRAYGHKECRNKDEDTASPDNSPNELAQRVAAQGEPIEADDNPEDHKIRSKQERSSAERANGEVQGGKSGLGARGGRHFLAAEE